MTQEEWREGQGRIWTQEEWKPKFHYIQDIFYDLDSSVRDKLFPVHIQISVIVSLIIILFVNFPINTISRKRVDKENPKRGKKIFKSLYLLGEKRV